MMLIGWLYRQYMSSSCCVVVVVVVVGGVVMLGCLVPLAYTFPGSQPW